MVSRDELGDVDVVAPLVVLLSVLLVVLLLIVSLSSSSSRLRLKVFVVTCHTCVADDGTL